MAKISFYQLTTMPIEKALPKLLEKIIQSYRVVVLGKSEEYIEHLNRNFWTYSRFFLPHGSHKDEFKEMQPIYLTNSEENPNAASVLVATEMLIPKFFNEFDRVIDMFDGSDQTQLEEARKRYISYKSDKNNELLYWKQDDKGNWVGG